MSFLVAAYLLLWVILFGYLIRLGQRQRELGRQLEAVERALQAEQAHQREA